MAKIYDRDGVVFLEGDYFDLKIDGSRKIYAKRKEKSLYNYIGHECPRDMFIDEKKEFLSKLNGMLEAKLRESQDL